MATIDKPPLASLDNGFIRKIIVVKIRTAKTTFFIFLLLA
jgi:hypothetical protein